MLSLSPFAQYEVITTTIHIFIVPQIDIIAVIPSVEASGYLRRQLNVFKSTVQLVSNSLFVPFNPFQINTALFQMFQE